MSERASIVRLFAFLALFAGLTWLGVRSASPAEDTSALWRTFLSLPFGTHALLALSSIGLIATEMLRFFVFGRALGVRIGPLALLDATVANNFFSWITPFALLGDPAAIYMLGRRGVPWDASALIAFGKFATSYVFIMGLTSLLIAFGLGPSLPAWIVGPFLFATGSVAVLLAIFAAGALKPERTNAWIDRIEARLSQGRLERPIAFLSRESRRAVDRLGRFRAGGLLAIFGSHALYYLMFVGILVLLAIAFGGEDVPLTTARAIIYQGFIYVAPTPGGAGVGEATAELFFGEVLLGGRAFVVVVLFRALTFHLHVLVGLVYLPFCGGVRHILLNRSTQR